jgi:DNA-binding NtrC family response regulator
MANGIHILIVEDEPLVLDALQTTLETEYRISSVRTVDEARVILRTARIDVALIDSVLPDGRGAEIAILAERAGATVIEMTGYAPEEAALDAIGRRHLFKPFGANVLLSTVGDALRDQRRVEGGEDCMTGETKGALA